MSSVQGMTTKSGRVVRLTPKMEEFFDKAKKGSTSRFRKELMDKTEQVEKLISQDKIQVQEIQEKYDEIIEEQNKLFQMEEQEASELENDEKGTYREFYAANSITIIDKADAIKEFLVQSAIEPEDSASQTGSKVSTASQRYAILEERTRQAELEFERKRLLQQAELDQERHKLEQWKRELEQKEKLQQLERELELSKVKVEIMSQAGSDVGSRVSGASKRSRKLGSDVGKPSKRHKRQEVPTSSPQKGYVPPKFDFTQRSRPDQITIDNRDKEPIQLENAFSKLADAISKSSRHTVQIEPDVFTGDVMTYELWKRNFEELVERDVKLERRFIYLLKYTGGQARECIDNLTHLNSKDAYEEGLRMLDERYGDKFISYEAIREKLDSWPYVKDGEGIALRKFTDFLCTCLAAMQTNASLKILDTMPENHKLLKKLPRRIVDKWSNKVDDWQYGGKCNDSSREYPPFFVFVEFLKKQARIELGPVKRMMNKEYNKFKSVKVHLTDVEETEEVGCYATHTAGENERCVCCDGAHGLAKCPKFVEMTAGGRLQFSYDKKLCRACLGTGHFAWACKDVQRCGTCQGRHHQLFHDDNFKGKGRTQQNNGTSTGEKRVVLSTKVDDDNVTAHIVLADVSNSEKPGSTKRVYVVIDNQSNACFISKQVANELGAIGKKTNVELHTMAGVEDVTLDKVEGLIVASKQGDARIELPPTYIKDGMETGYDQIPSPADVRKWKHLQKIWHLIEEVDHSVPVALLVGRNCYKGTKLTDFIPSNDAEPYAVCTSLGWGIVGKLQGPPGQDKSTVWVHTVSAREPSPAKFFESCSVDFQDQHAEGKMSYDDRRFVECLKRGMTRGEDGRVTMPLPVRNQDPIPDNAGQARASLNGLRKKFDKDPEYKKKFVSKMEELFTKGYAEPVDNKGPEGRTYHLTFHGVFHPKKVDELRVVFNGARRYMGFVLNELLLQGPDQTNNLFGVFCRFRKELVTLTCDIEAMFYQVMVKPEDRDLLRFFWWPDGNTEAEPREFRMMVHIFGATSSPGVAGHTLLKIADLFEEKYGKETADFIREGFYVDDGVTAITTDEKALTLMMNSRALCAEGKFNLTKFSSNRRSVVEKIPVEIRAKNLKELDMVKDKLPKGYTLGIFLCNEDDCIRFQVCIALMPRTRRGILSTVSQVYDPLGLASPFLLEGKRILQQICKQGLDWDEPIPDDMLKKWDAWIEQVKGLEEIAFPRCYSTRGVEASLSRELHHFADASLSGYGQCSYIRLMYPDGAVETSLVMAKAKVLPKQTVTVPRLELAAAVLAVRMARFLQEQLKIDKLEHHYWTDSRVVLGYINNDSKRFHIYVANRVANIRESSEPNQWHHVDTEQNPADLASRGTTVEELKNSQLWKIGPEFLRSDKKEWTPEAGVFSCDDPEVRKVAAFATEIQADAVNWEDKFARFSTWKSLTRGMAKVTQLTGKNDDMHTVTLEERRKSETLVLRKSQETYFKQELAALRKMKDDPDRELPAVLKTGRLRKLDPFLDEQGVIRVGGRFKNGPWAYEMKHPVILPGECHVSELLIRYIHAQVAHCGREATMSALRASGYWILSVRRKIDSEIWKCVICTRFRGKSCKQKMGEMPEERQEEVAAFTHVGVDFFGPYPIKQGRAQVKRYIVIYTCLVTRATHLDKAYGLSSDQFINSYRRFLSRRGAVRTLRSDRGTNFVGACDEIQRNLEDVFNEDTKRFLIESQCEFVTMKMNPPHASHMGGVWERPIGTAKRIINVLLKEHSGMLDDDLLDTVLAETEAVMNGMPLTNVDTSGADSVKPLTPAMLLTMKPSIAPPPLHKFDSPDVFSRRRWKRAQHVVDEFWKRWRLELLPKWQERKKWVESERNLAKDDIVLMMEENAPRMSWPMGRVVEVYPGDDGLVRSVKIDTQKSSYTRPIHKLLLLTRGSIPVKEANPKDQVLVS